MPGLLDERLIELLSQNARQSSQALANQLPAPEAIQPALMTATPTYHVVEFLGAGQDNLTGEDCILAQTNP